MGLDNKFKGNERIGEERYNYNGLLMRITGYRNRKDIDVYFPEFDWTYYNSNYDNFKSGKIKCKVEHRNEQNYNSFGSLMIIQDYRKSVDIDVYFPEFDWVYEHARYEKFKSGALSCPYEPRNHGVGYIGEGPYRSSQNHIHTRVYDIWNHMLQRCYSKSNVEKYPTYVDCWVCEEWLNFQNFAKWYESNYYEIPGERMEIDKDILYKGNKVYSPETCVIVPHNINTLFIKSDNCRGTLPIGVNYDVRYDTYNAHCNDHGELIWLGSFKTVDDAFITYKIYKEQLIKNMAEEYKYYIPEILYNAMINYKVEIDD